MIDLHCHLLPGIDDGPRNWDESIALCRAMAADGILVAVTTPHLIDGVYENTLAVVRPLVDELNGKLEDLQIELMVHPGAEIDISSRFVVEKKEELPILAGGPCVLLEMPVAVVPSALDRILFDLRSSGILPVLAHPERNEHVQRDPGLVAGWHRSGAAIQVDAESLFGVWGRRAEHSASSLLRRGLVNALASDAHSCDRRPPRLREAVEVARQLIGDQALQLVTDGPASILRGKRLDLTPVAHSESQQSRRAAKPSLWKQFRSKISS